MTADHTPSAERLVAEARRAVHESLIVLPAPEADRVRALIADLETAVESRTAIRMADAATPPAARLLDCGYCYEENGQEVHPHPECPIGQPAAGRAALRDRIAAALADAMKPRYGGPQHNTPGGLPLTATAEEVRLHRAQPLADAVLAVLPPPVSRADVLRKAADDLWAMANRLTERGQGVLWAADRLRRMADEAQPGERPRCEHCGLPHDLTPGSLPATVCAATRQRIAEAEQRHAAGDHGLCCRADCDVLQRRAAEAQPECSASRTGHCLREAESETACDTEAGECVHGGRPADEAQSGTEAPETGEALCRCGHGKAYHGVEYGTPRCRLCPERGEWKWDHAYTTAAEAQQDGAGS